MNTIPQEDTPYKRCPSCSNIFPATTEFFFRNKQSRDGLQTRCKKCQSIAAHGRPPKYYRNDIPKGYKRCPHCEQVLPATPELFSRSTREKDGLYYCCKACQQSRWRIKHPTQPREIIPEGHKRCSKCGKSYPATVAFFCNDKNSPDKLTYWCRGCIKCCRDQKKEYRARYNSQYAKDHKEERRESNRNYQRLYYYRPEKRERVLTQGRIRSSRRRSRKQAIPGDLTPQQIQEKLKAQRYRCYYAACGHAKFERVNGEYVYHLEHTIPISRTESQPRHDVNYVVLACPACNLKKHNKLPHEFFEGGRLF